MAQGDKKPVIMEADIGVVGGVPPYLHASQHSASGPDPITPSMIGAENLTNSNNTLIADGTDLDTLTAAGNYYCGYAANVATLINCPVTVAFKMVVKQLTTKILKQEIVVLNVLNATSIFRTRNADEVWGSWYTAATTDYVREAAASNPNLLDNWYFADPIDQRGGWVIPPGVVYAVPGTSGSTTKTDKYYKVDRISTGGYPYITIDGVEYVTNPGTEIRGYVGAGYTIDRWRSNNDSSVTICDDGISVNFGGAHYVYQPLEEPAQLAGKTVTLSALRGENGRVAIRLRSNGTILSGSIFVAAENSCGSITVTIPEDCTSLAFELGASATNVEHKVIAVKLELGSTQTLAHQDADGNWVLNDPPPDKALELAKCQRYFYRLKTHNDNAYGILGLGFVSSVTQSRFLINLPVPLRINPAVSFSGSLAVMRNGKFVTITGVGRQSFNGDSIALYGDHAESADFGVGANVALNLLNDADAYVDFDANL